MKLEVGQPAPQFAAKDLYGRPVSLANYAGSYLLVSFYRFAVCPLCNLRMWHLIRRYADYQRQGLNILAFTESAPENAHGYLDRLQCPFPIVADLTSRVYAEYGLETSPFGVVRALLGRQAAYLEASRLNIGGWNILRMDGVFTRLPADFIIGPDRRVALAYYGRDSGGFLLFDRLDAFLSARPRRAPRGGPPSSPAGPARACRRRQATGLCLARCHARRRHHRRARRRFQACPRGRVRDRRSMHPRRPCGRIVGCRRVGPPGRTSGGVTAGRVNGRDAEPHPPAPSGGPQPPVGDSSPLSIAMARGSQAHGARGGGWAGVTENEGTQAGVVAEGGRGGAARRRPEGRGESWLVGGSWGGPRAPWAWYGDGGWGGGGWGGAGERRGYQKMNGRDGMDGHALREDEGRDRSGGRRGPPHMGELKRRADAQAPVLRAQLRAVMRLDGLSVEEVARRARLDLAALAAFAAGASINPRWQEKLARWLDDATDHPVDASGDALGGASGDASGDASGGALG